MPLLVGLVEAPTPAGADTAVSRELEVVNPVAKGDTALDAGVTELGPTTPYTCPDCSGLLLRLYASTLQRTTRSTSSRRSTTSASAGAASRTAFLDRDEHAFRRHLLVVQAARAGRGRAGGARRP